jgi:hypothetical protein
MNLMLKIATFSCAGLTLLGSAGCKVTECEETQPDGGVVKKENCVTLQPTIEYRDARLRTGAQAWTTGRSFSITNRNGPVTVAVGSAGDERVQFSGTPFTRETDDDEGRQKATNKLGAMADPAFGGGDYISLVAPGGGVDGYDLKVWVPPTFDAALTVVTENGTTTVHGADGTTSTTVTSHAIIATNLKRTVNLHSEVGDIDASGVPSGTGNVIRADLGDIVARIGAGANLGITAKSDSGMVTFPTEWNQTVNPDRMAGSATLGDGSGTLSVTTGGGDITFAAQ